MNEYHLFFKTIYGVTIISLLAFLWTLASELVHSIMATIKHYEIKKILNTEKEEAPQKREKKTRKIKTIRKTRSTALQESCANVGP